MGAPKVRKSVHNRVSTAIERLEALERLIGAGEDEDGHVAPETVEESVRRLKIKVPPDTPPAAKG